MPSARPAVFVRCENAAEKAGWEAAARATGLPLSVWIRLVVRDGMRRKIAITGRLPKPAKASKIPA